VAGAKFSKIKTNQHSRTLAEAEEAQKCISSVPLAIFRPGVSSPGSIRKGISMHLDIISLQPLVALLFGILILVLPSLLNYLIGIYLILVGLVGLFPHLFSSLR
jgi:hypothetical protein